MHARVGQASGVIGHEDARELGIELPIELERHVVEGVAPRRGADGGRRSNVPQAYYAP